MRWPGYQHIFFDCDSTLTTVEGIDVLAESVGKSWRVGVLTQAAMDGELDLEEIYAKRLKAVKPTRKQVREIRRTYKRNIVEDARELINTLQVMGHQVYIISGGLAEPVEEFGVSLGVPKSHIRAVDVSYNELSGKWWLAADKLGLAEERLGAAYDERFMAYQEGALTVSDGKAQIVNELLQAQGGNGRSLLIGDGNSDLLASHAVDLFVGFGGVVERQRVAQEAPLYLHSNSLAPLLLIAAGPAVLRRLKNLPHTYLGEKALKLLETGVLTFNDEQLKTKFYEAIKATKQTPYSLIGESPNGHVKPLAAKS